MRWLTYSADNWPRNTVSYGCIYFAYTRQSQVHFAGVFMERVCKIKEKKTYNYIM